MQKNRFQSGCKLSAWAQDEHHVSFYCVAAVELDVCSIRYKAKSTAPKKLLID
jgi:hypothetical protein